MRAHVCIKIHQIEEVIKFKIANYKFLNFRECETVQKGSNEYYFMYIYLIRLVVAFSLRSVHKVCMVSVVNLKI